VTNFQKKVNVRYTYKNAIFNSRSRYNRLQSYGNYQISNECTKHSYLLYNENSRVHLIHLNKLLCTFLF